MRSSFPGSSQAPTDSDINDENTTLAETKDEIQKSNFDALIAAIRENDDKKVMAYIQEGVDINALTPDVSGEYFFFGEIDGDNNQHEFTTPLGLAVFQLNYTIVRILLENGANPNITGNVNRSMIEMVMISMGVIAQGQAMDQPLKRKLQVTRDFSLPIKIKTTIRSSVIQNAHEVLDLLLCYGLKPHAVWTTLFEKGQQGIMQVIGYNNGSIAIKKRCLQEMDREIDALEIGRILKTIVSTIGHVVMWYKGRKIVKPINYFYDYLYSIAQIRQRAAVSAAEIHQEIEKYQVEVEIEILTNIQKLATSVWPTELTDLVVEYMNIFAEISKKIANRRLHMKEIIKFWQIAPDHKEENELKQMLANQTSEILAEPAQIFFNNASTQEAVLREEKCSTNDDSESLDHTLVSNSSSQSTDLSERKSSPNPSEDCQPISPLRRNSIMRQADNVKADEITGTPAPLSNECKANYLTR